MSKEIYEIAIYIYQLEPQELKDCDCDLTFTPKLPTNQIYSTKSLKFGSKCRYSFLVGAKFWVVMIQKNRQRTKVYSCIMVVDRNYWAWLTGIFHMYRKLCSQLCVPYPAAPRHLSYKLGCVNILLTADFDLDCEEVRQLFGFQVAMGDTGSGLVSRKWCKFLGRYEAILSNLYHRLWEWVNVWAWLLLR